MSIAERCLMALLAASALYGQSGCATLPVTGAWIAYASDGTTIGANATLTQSGTTWSGSYRDTAITGHGDLVGTFSGGTISGNTYKASLVVKEPSDGSGIIATGTITFTLSADGTTLAGNFSAVITQPPPDPGQPPSGSSGAFNLYRSSGIAMAPSTVDLTGAAGGQPVIDSSTLSLYNCSINSQTFTLSATSAWLGAVPASGSNTLTKASSTTITLTADPSKLAESTTPYQDVVTATSSGGTATAAISFLVGSGKNAITLSGVVPPPESNLETGKSVTYTVKVGGSLTSAANGTLALQLFDDAGNPIGPTSSVSISQGAIDQTLKVTATIPDGTQEVQLTVVVTPKNQQPTQYVAASYLVYPPPKIFIGFGGGGLWGPPASAPNFPVGIVIGFKPGSPDYGTTLTMTATNSDGSSAGTIAPIDVSLGAGYYPALLSPVVSNGSQGITVQVAFGDLAPYWLSDPSPQATLPINAPPNITSFQIAGPDGNFADASQSIILGADPSQANLVVGRLSYTGLDAEASATMGSGITIGGTSVAPVGNSTVQLTSLPAQAGGGPGTYTVRITNSFGQFVSTSSSAAEYVESVHITQASLSGTALNVGAQYVWPGTKSLVFSYLGLANFSEFVEGGDSGAFPCVAATTTPTPARSSCPSVAVVLDPADVFLQVKVFDVGGNGAGAQDFLTIPVPKTVPVTGGTVAQAGPVKATPSSSGPAVTAKAIGGSIGKDFLTATGLGSENPGPPTSFRQATFAGNAPTAPAGSLVFVGTAMNFSPAVPNNSTLMVYSYTASDLPDDPNFNASNLEMVSFDPATGQYTTYPSTVDTNAMTVTATLPGIPPYLGLAVPASTLGPQLNLPFDPQGAPSPAGIALFNAGAGPSNITLIGRGGNGTVLAPQPSTTEAIPGQQASATFDSLGAATVTNPGWVQASANAPGTVGTAILANLSSLESLPLTPGSYTEVIPGIELATGNLTQVSVANATSILNQVSLELHDTTGKLVDTAQLSLDRKQAVTASLGALFANAQAPVQGYVIVYGGDRLSAAAVANVGNAVSALPGQSLFANGTSLYAPHFVTGPGQTSRLDIVNPGATTAHVTIQAAKDDGTLLAKLISTSIAPGAQYWIDLAGTLGLNTKAFTSGSISVSSDQPGLIGDVTITDSSPLPNYRTSIPLAPAQNSQAIPYVLNTTALPMTVYAANTGVAKANVTFTLYGVDGSVLGTAAPAIVAGGRLVSPLSTFLAAAAGQTGGALEIDSDQPLSVAGLILPANAGADWAAIPAQPSSLVKPAGPTPLISTGGITNAAVAKTVLARGELATIYGSNFTSSPATTYTAAALPLPLELGNVFVTVGGIPAPMYYINQTQINFQVPFEVPSGQPAKVVVSVNGVRSAAASVMIADYALGVFSYFRTSTAYDPIIVHFSNNTLVTPSSPAAPGEIIVIYATGIGKLTNPPADGAGAPGVSLAQAVDSPSITIGGVPSGTVYFAGLTPGAVGLAQFDVTLPANLPSGNLPVAINFPGGDSNPIVNLAVQGNIAGGSPQLSVSTNSVSLGNVTVGQSATQTVNLNNTGTATLTLNNVSVSGAGFSLAPLPNAVSIAAGSSQPAMVKFAPTSAGPANGTLSITSNGGNASVSLSGTGVAAGAPAIAVSATSLSFGSVTTGQTSSQSFTVSNTGAASLTVSSIGTPSGFSVVSPALPFTIASGGAPVTVTAQFAPTNATAYSGNLTILSNDPAHGSVSVALSGTGASAIPLACGFTLDSVTYAKWTALGGSNGVLGCPTANEISATASPQGSTGKMAAFANGVIYEHLTGPFAGQAYEIHSCTPTAYASQGGSGSNFGFPVSDQYAVDGGFRNDFQGGYILGATGSPNCSSYGIGHDFTGLWSTDRGTATIVQNSLDATGTYGTSGGMLTGNASGAMLSSTWQDSSGQGQATFTLSADGSSFTGQYGKAGALPNTQWNGTRTANGSVGWFTPMMLNFGAVPVNTTQTLNMIAFAPQVALTLQNVTSDNAAFKIGVGSSQILPGGSVTIPIRFTPTGTGNVTGHITITTLDAARPQIVITVAGAGQ